MTGPEERIQRRIFARGRVQGVSYRASTAAEAERLAGETGAELRGWVRNLDDGSVEAVIAGPERAVLRLVAWCRQGPPAARVDELEVREEELDPALPAFGVRVG
jgi:acylphosphatase